MEESPEDRRAWQKILRPLCFGNWNCLVYSKKQKGYKEHIEAYRECDIETRRECHYENNRRRQDG